MQVKPQISPLLDVDRESTPFRLAGLQQGDSAFVSCYLDTRSGQQACIAFLDQKAARIRSTLRGVDRFFFDTAVETIRRAVDTHWRLHMRGMALFARGTAKDRHLTVCHSATPFDNRLVCHSLPEVLPLIALHQREPAFRLLLVHRRRLQLFEANPDSELALVYGREAERPGGTGEFDDESIAPGAPPSMVSRDALWKLRKALSESPLPLFIAGESKALRSATDWLPRRAAQRLSGRLPILPGTGVESMMKTIRRRLGTSYCEESSRLADALAGKSGLRSHAALGYRPALDAIRCSNAEAVVIADWDHPGLGLPREAEIEICFAALRRGIRVLLADSLRLRKAGGVACLLRQPSGQAATAAADHAVRIDRVA
jgi:hypothetical protein